MEVAGRYRSRSTAEGLAPPSACPYDLRDAGSSKAVNAHANSTMSRSVVLEACPFLGIEGDRPSHYQFPSGAHRCHKGATAHIGLDHQANYCLRDTYVTCPVYQGLQALASSPDRPPRTFGQPVALLSIPLIVAVIAITAALAYAGAVIQPSSSTGSLIGVASPTPLATPTNVVTTTAPPVTPSPTRPAVPTPTPTPSETPAPPTTTPTPTAAPPTASPVPSPKPTPRPTPLIHIVERGDTLSGIAQLYGVTVKAIVAANDLESADFIYNGQRLIIPQPSGN